MRLIWGVGVFCIGLGGALELQAETPMRWKQAFESYLSGQPSDLDHDDYRRLQEFVGEVKVFHQTGDLWGELQLIENTNGEVLVLMWSDRPVTLSLRERLRMFFDTWLAGSTEPESYEAWREFRARVLNSYLEASRANQLLSFSSETRRFWRASDELEINGFPILIRLSSSHPS